MNGQDNLNPRYIKTEVEVKIEAITEEIMRIGMGQTIDQTVGIDNSSGKAEVDTDLGKVTGEVTSEIIPEVSTDKITEENIGITVTGVIVMTEVGIGLEKDHFQEIMAVTELVDQGQDPELVQTRIG